MTQKLAPAKKIAEIYLPYLPLFASLCHNMLQPGKAISGEARGSAHLLFAFCLMQRADRKQWGGDGPD